MSKLFITHKSCNANLICNAPYVGLFRMCNTSIDNMKNRMCQKQLIKKSTCNNDMSYASMAYAGKVGVVCK